MESVTRVQILDEAVSVSLNDNPFEIICFFLVQIIRQIGQPVEGKDNSEFKPAELHLKTDLVSHFDGGIGWIYTFQVFFYQKGLCHYLKSIL